METYDQPVYMSFDDYQKATQTTDIYPVNTRPYCYALGLAGEAGEVCDKLKKIYRDSNGVFSNDKLEAIAKELGDVLWYVSRLSTAIGYHLEDIALINIAKLKQRQKNNTLNGSGDDR